MYLLNGTSVITGYYYIKNNSQDRSSRFLIKFLLFDFIVSTIGMFTRIIKYNESLHYLKDTLFYNEYWFFNPVIVIIFALYAMYFRSSLHSKLFRQLLIFGIILFIFFIILLTYQFGYMPRSITII
jgi:hypothetical protein